MGEIQVVFTAGGFLGHLGRVFGLTWTHVAFRFRDFSGEWRVIESSIHGVVERDWLSFVGEAFDHRLYEPSSPLSEEQSYSLIGYIWQCVGRPYDYWGFVRVIWRELRRRWLLSALMARSYICSGLVYDAFLQIGLDLAPGHADLLILPDELLVGSLLVEVAE